MRRRVEACDRDGGGEHPPGRARQVPRVLDDVAGAGRAHHAACRAARSRGLLRARRPISAAVVAADDGDSGGRRGRAEVIAVCPRPDPTVLFAAREAGVSGCSASAARTRSPRWRTAPRSIPRVDKIVGPGNAYVAAAKAQVARDCAIDFFAGPERNRRGVVDRRPRMDCRRSDRAGRARSGRAGDSVHARRRRWRWRWRAEIDRQMPRSGRAGAALRAQRRHHRHRHAGRGHRLCPAAGARARRLRHRRGGAPADPRGNGVRRQAERPGVRRLRDRIESRAADERRRGGARRAERGRLRAGLAVQRITAAASSASGLQQWRSPRPRAWPGMPRRSRSGCGLAPQRPRTAAEEPGALMSHQYQRPIAAGGLRLHLNENTAGCSPRVMDVLREPDPRAGGVLSRLRPRRRAPRPRGFGVRTDNVLLTNGLDDGILLAALVALRGGAGRRSVRGDRRPAGLRHVCGLRRRRRRPDRRRPAAGGLLLSAAAAWSRRSTPKTRMIFLTNPNNPTGLSIPASAVAAVAQAAPHALVFLDEAYADFSGQTMIEEAASGQIPNLIVGRTFAKAYGLAGLRVGALVGSRRTLAPMRRAVPPYTLNAYAAAALPAALEDRDYYEWYLAEVRESKKLLVRRARAARRAVLAERRQLRARLLRRRPRARRSRGWPSAASTSAIDRSDPGCAGCARITAGVLEHTRRARRRARGGAVRRAVINRKTTETQIALPARARRQGALRRLDRHQVLRSHAGAGHPPRRLRSAAARHRRSRRRSAPHRRGRRHRARRGGVGGARQPPRHQPRRLLRHADGRNARRRRHRPERADSRGDRPASSRSAASAISRRSSCTTSSTASRRARGPTSTSRCSTAARATIRSRRCSRRSRARCAMRARRTGGSRGSCPAPRSCCDCADRLRRRQPDVGPQGLRRGRRRALHARTARRARRRRRRSSSPASAISRRRPRSTASGATAIRGALDRARLLFGICLGQQWLFEGSDEDPDVPGLGVIRGPLPAAAADVEGAARRLELAGDPQAVTAARRHREPARRPISPIPTPPTSRLKRSATTTHAAPFASVVETERCSACSSIRRSPATPGVQMLRNFVAAMLSKRLIACLDVRNGCVVKGVQFEGLRNAGDPGGPRAPLQPSRASTSWSSSTSPRRSSRARRWPTRFARCRASSSFRWRSAAASGRSTMPRRRSRRARTRSA